MKANVFVLAFTVVWTFIFTNLVFASTFSFTFTSDGSNIFTANNVSGTVSGLIFGLTDNGSGQQPTSAEIVSSPIGLTNFTLPYISGSFDVIAGQIVAANDVVFETCDSYTCSADLVFNYFTSGYGNFNRASIFSPGSASITSNFEGFGGVTYVSTAPLPGALPLFATGLGVMGLIGWWKKLQTEFRKAAARRSFFLCGA